MKKLFTLIALLISALVSNAQLCENWTTYDSTTANANYNGWTLNYFSKYSYYTSVGSSSTSGPNSYKFGVDSATLITPNILGYDSISFWMKGNAATGGSMAQGKFYISETSDGINYTQLDVIFPITPGGTGMVKSYLLSAGTTNVKFFYDKDSGNVAFDDFCASARIVGISEASATAFSAYPNPSRGVVSLAMNNPLNGQVIITDVLGNEMKRFMVRSNEINPSFDLSELRDGIYFLKLKSDKGETSKRIVLKK